MPMIAQLIVSSIVMVLCFTVYFMLRYMRKHPQNDICLEKALFKGYIIRER
jgi:hypothetical protein